jgi:hypothetical protein
MALRILGPSNCLFEKFKMKKILLLFPFFLFTLGGCSQPPPAVQMILAITEDDPAAIKKAIQAGAKVKENFKYKEAENQNDTQWRANPPWRSTPLTYAVKQNKPRAVQALIAAGADANAIDEEGNIPLFVVPPVEIGEILIKGGADVNRPYPKELRNKFKPTPLIQAVLVRDRKFAEMLLKHGAKVQAKDGDGATAWRYVHPERPDLRKLLLAYGANPKDSGPSIEELKTIRLNRLKADEDREAAAEAGHQARLRKKWNVPESMRKRMPWMP